VTSILLVGAGEVGARTARQLVDTPGLERLAVTGRTSQRSVALAGAMGERAESLDRGAARAQIADFDVVALALPGEATRPWARAALAARRPIVSAADDEPTITGLLALDAEARRAGVLVVPGAGLTPGLSEVLARHAADGLAGADEAHVARVGIAGEASLESSRRERRERPLEWHDGAWRAERRRGHQLVWFPEPVGARECESVSSGIALLVAALPGLRHATVRFGDPMPSRPVRSWLGRRRDDPWGATRVEVWGWSGGGRIAIVYGVIDRPAVAAGTVLAVTAARLGGLVPEVEVRGESVGARGLAEVMEPAPLLAELARRGVRAAAFEGVSAA